MMADRCGCCAVGIAVTPLELTNRPGLSAVAYRVGTYGSFLRAMLTRIARDIHPNDPDYPWAIRELQTRASDDYAVTLLEMWAAIADVLAFHEERFANESFLRTATQRDSVLRLARLVGYELRPGVAATTLLAFTLDPAAKATLPVGLRVQSVPAEGETAQKFETTASLTADGRFNRLVVSAKPVAANPLALGRTSAVIAPGDQNRGVAASLRPGERVMLFNDNTPADALEFLSIRAIGSIGDLFELSWTSPIASTAWTPATRAQRFNRAFHVFGYNAPEKTMTPTVDTTSTPSIIGWDQANTVVPDPSGQATLLLDGKYDGLKIGQQILISEPGLVLTTRIITGVDQAVGHVANVTDTVTRLTLNANLPNFTDPRAILVHELTSDQIPFWPWEYPQRLLSGSCWMPGRRTGWTTIEIGRTIVAGEVQTGVILDLRSIERNRPTILADAADSVIPTTIASARLAGTDLRFGPAAADSTAAASSGLDTGDTLPVTALISGALNPFPSLGAAAREILVTIGEVGPRRVSISGATTPASLALQLESAIRAADPAVDFTKAIVRRVRNRVVIVAGIPGAAVQVAAAPTDPNAVVMLALDSSRSEFVDGVLSAPLDDFTGLGPAARAMSVAFGAEDPRTITLPAPINTILDLRNALSGALNTSSSGALVEVVDGRLLIVPGLDDSPVQSFLALELNAGDRIDIDAQRAVLLGNVAPASHGETSSGEILGSADAAAPFQSWVLKKNPLTYLSGVGPGGVASTLQLLVNGVRWREVPTLYGRAAVDQVYVTRLADDGTTRVQFGDGVTGARPPSGVDNIVARYRKGSGLAGRVRAGGITNLLDRPIGVRGVVNPAATDGGADAQSATAIRRNAPMTVRTFDRAVSLRDFVDLVTESGEVAKAEASWVWSGDARGVTLTVAGQQGSVFSRDALARLYATLTAERDPNHPLCVVNFVRVPIVIAATLRIMADRDARVVLDAARAALGAALGFETLSLGRPLHLSDLYGILQSVDGVEYVDIDRLHFKDRSPANLTARGADLRPVQDHLRFFAARLVAGAMKGAEQAWIEAATQDVTLLGSGGLTD
jgi:hypothetical protein